jgi:hypothetical protein
MGAAASRCLAGMAASSFRKVLAHLVSISDDGLAWQKPMDLIEFLGVMGTPCDERFQDGPQTFAQRSKQIFDALGVGGNGSATHHSMFLERSQLFDQNLLRYAGNALLQLGSALRAIHKDTQDDRLPPAGEDAQRALDRQARKSFDDLHVKALTNECVDGPPRDT